MKFIPITTPISSEAERLLDSFNKIYVNEGALFYQFEVHANETFSYFKSNFQLHKIDLINQLIFSEIFQETAKELTGLSRIDGGIPLNLFQVASRLAQDINQGGCYSKLYTAEDSMKLATDFIKCISDWRNDDFYCLILGSDWSSWFHRIVYDDSYLLFDSKKNLITLLCMSDYD